MVSSCGNIQKNKDDRRKAPIFGIKGQGPSSGHGQYMCEVSPLYMLYVKRKWSYRVETTFPQTVMVKPVYPPPTTLVAGGII